MNVIAKHRITLVKQSVPIVFSLLVISHEFNEVKVSCSLQNWLGFVRLVDANPRHPFFSTNVLTRKLIQHNPSIDKSQKYGPRFPRIKLNFMD